MGAGSPEEVSARQSSTELLSWCSCAQACVQLRQGEGAETVVCSPRNSPSVTFSAPRVLRRALTTQSGIRGASVFPSGQSWAGAGA